MFENTLTVRQKLSLAFGSLNLLLLVVAAYAVWALNSAHGDFERFVQGINARALLAADVVKAAERRAIAARNLVLLTEPRLIETEKAVVQQAQAEVTQKLGLLVQMAQKPDVPDEARRHIAEIERIERLYAPVATGIVEQALAGRLAQASDRIVRECMPLLASLNNAADAYADFTAERSQRLVAEGEDRFETQRIKLGMATLLALLSAGLAGWAITRSLTRALGAEPSELAAAAQRVAQGDLGPVPGSAQAPSGSVLASLGDMQASLHNVVATVRQGAESVSSASSQIAQGNADLSARTESQASALEQTAASMEQLSSAVQQTADNARQATQLAVSASDMASRGGQVVTEVIQTMKAIDASSKRIADIISVIDGIAFQTNILALNAAVEAARAGDQGRGFAVVAGEVRSLAQRSAQAAKEIEGLISSSVSQVEQGAALVDQAGTSMQDIVAGISRVRDIMAQISAASSEQSAGVHQVGAAVTQMDQSTQQNAAMVEEMAAAASSLKTQAEALVDVVGVFDLGQGTHAARQVTAVVSPRQTAAPALDGQHSASRLRAPMAPALPSVSAA